MRGGNGRLNSWLVECGEEGFDPAVKMYLIRIEILTRLPDLSGYIPAC